MNIHDQTLTNSPLPRRSARNDNTHQCCVLITGAANGLGRATALEFGRRGWNVIATDIDQFFWSLPGEPHLSAIGENAWWKDRPHWQ